MNMKTVLSAIAAFAVVAAGAQTPASLKVGDKAPALKVAKWVKGKPVKTFEKGQVYVVEFWATWCGPCKVSIPHITELAKKYGKKVNFTGVSVWEVQPGTKDDGYMKKVDDFVKEMGDKMNYNVAVDGLDATMAKTWMEAAGQDGIPAAFIVDKNGTIAWIGHPMADMDGVLQKVIDGKFDTKAEADLAAKKEAEAKKMMEMTKGLREALAANDLMKAVGEIDKIVAEKPEMESQLGQTKYMILIRIDEPKAYEYAKKASAGVFKDNAEMLNLLSWTIVDDKSELKIPDYKLAVDIATKACELTKFENSMILDTLAYAYFKNGNIDKAIEYQEKAVKFIKKDEMPAEMQKEITERLDMFKKKKAGGGLAA